MELFIIYMGNWINQEEFERQNIPFSSSENVCVYNTILSDTLYKIIGLFIYKNNDSLAAC